MNVLLIGSNGKMGKKMQALLSQKRYNFLGIDKENRKDADPFQADVIIDFSSAECLKDNLEIAKEKHIPIVIATTNHDESNLKLIEESKNIIPIFMSSNFSFMFQVLLQIARCLQSLNYCDFTVQDIHHKHKKDSPSGSCKQILEILDRQKITPQISSFRVGEIVGIHNIQAFSENECLEIKHQVFDRQVFCEGALKAAEFLISKTNGLYTMQDLLKL